MKLEEITDISNVDLQLGLLLDKEPDLEDSDIGFISIARIKRGN